MADCVNNRSENVELTPPRVSIIIPCYKTANLVAETLRSVFAQTYENYEAVIVNDGSPDSAELERALAPWRDRIVYVKTENFGLAGARNNGIRASRGELIALLDSDDLWEPDYLEVQVRKLDEDPSADIVYPKARFFGDGPEVGSFSPPSTGDVTFTSLLDGTCVVVISVLARRSVFDHVGLFDASLRSCEDFDMWLRCVKSGIRIIYHDKVLLHYRRREGSLSSDLVWMHGSALKVLNKVGTSLALTEQEQRALEAAVHRFEGNKFFYEGKDAFVQGDMATAIDRLNQANSRLHSPKIAAIVLMLRTMPSFARAAYAWMAR
jgi:glycosyltransferase involved in cell wall biosynthesis